jgi:2-iminobutanoate/2-iminopropanoate deaminase
MIESIENTGVPQAKGTGSAGVKLGDFIFVSGQLPLQEDGMMCQGDIREQTRICLHNLQQVLRAAGLDLHYILQIRIYLTDMNEEPAMSEVFNEIMPQPQPARVCVGAAALQGGSHIEMEAYAVDTRALDVLCAQKCSDSCCSL